MLGKIPMPVYKTNAKNKAFCIFAGVSLSIFPSYFLGRWEPYGQFYHRYIHLPAALWVVYGFGLAISYLSLLVWSLSSLKDEPFLARLGLIIFLPGIVGLFFPAF
jgi:hypothetical protein